MNSSVLFLLLVTVILINNIECLNYRPQFSTGHLISSLYENSPTGTSVTKLSDHARDDEGDLITYSLDTIGQSYCNIDSITGLVTLSKTLDREVKSFVEFTAFAEDSYEGGGALRQASIKVFIYVLDVNDWPPEFQGTPYTASIKENASIHQSVLTLRATDQDEGSNAEITFGFKNGTQIPQFSLDVSSGLIKVAGLLDYETTTRYTLSVIAKDKGIPSLSSETRVIVDVEDVGDNPPVFTPSANYETKVNENLPINDKVISVRATDGDRGINNAINYQIISGNDQGLFSIDSSTGDIKVNGQLDRETSLLYQLRIKAYEVPVPSSFALAIVTVQLNDINDFVPTFKNSSYVFTVDEDKPVGFIISQQLTASDHDATVTNNAFQYLLSGADSTKFAVNSLSGQLTVNSLLDFEGQEIYNFEILAKETLSTEKLTGNASVVIHLKNVNDNSPIFNQSTYVFQVHENAEVETVVGVVQASDADKGYYGEVTYSLNFPSQAASALFKINATDGKISLKSQPDYETASSHEFQVFATDGGGSNSKASNAIIKIEIVDINDNSPVFTNLPARIFVPENKLPGRIFTIKASDRDHGLNGKITFKLLNATVPEFLFDASTGDLNSTSSFDHESTRNYFILMFMAHDSGEEQRNATQTLEIVVQDENDFAPVFSKPAFNVSISESAKIGSLVFVLNASDFDSGANSKISYQILSGNDENTFSISSGQIITQDLLDRERIDSYELMVKASDHGSPPLSTTAKIFIKIEDYNDNFPNFLRPSYSVKVNESVAVNSSLVQFHTQDNDIGDNARVTYSIVSGNDEEKFKLLNESGELIVAKKLDWETKMTYILSIKAEDHGLVRKSRSTFLTIDVVDTNDNIPVFADSQYAFQTFENIAVGTIIGRVQATDADGKIPPNMNGIVRYSIINGNHKGTFRVDSILGILYSNGTIDREVTSLYNITVAASDGGYPINSANVQVTINVLDRNDNSPTFSNKTYYFEVYENVPIGYVISQIKATDKDSGMNARLSFAIVSGDVSNAFGIRSDGNLTVERSLDRESVEQFQLKINAIDTGSPQRSNATEVIIRLLDANDNSPVFQGTPYNAQVVEEQPAGIGILQVRATDADIGSNADIKYRIESPVDIFHINETSGHIKTKAVLDREKQSVYWINVSARDNGELKSVSYEIVTVTLLDLNDHMPVIGNLPNNTIVHENAPSGSTVYQIIASDDDDGENARLSYSVVSGDNGHFSVTTDGRIVTRALLDRETKDSYSILVNITDHGNPSLQVSSTLDIKVIDVNDNAPKFVPDPLLNPAWYSKTIPEGIASFNKTVFIVNATDADQGVNGGIEYSIENGNGKGFFTMNRETGEIKVSKMIDREDPGIDHNSVGLGTFSLAIKAKDQAPIGSQFVTTIVTILVSDVNDNQPVFDSPLYFAGVTEGADILTTVTTLTAHDKDMSENSRITYSITGGDPNGDFAILNRYVGTISVAKSINAERISVYNLTIMAKDGGDSDGGTALNSTTTVQIHVGDVNDNDPAFNQTVYKATLKENSPPETYVIRVSATDPDKGTNGEVWYQITSGNINDAFVIDNRTGVIVGVAAIDREKFSKYTLVIKAEDKGTPVTRKSSAHVIINIEDVNDNPMKFKAVTYFGNILENSPPGTKVTLTTPIEFNDADSDSIPSTLFISGTGHENFRVNSSSFSITSSSNSSFDRESNAIFYLTITVRDTDGLFSTAGLVIVVDDVNDNRPTFNVSDSIVTVNESFPVGYNLMQIIAYDKDDGSNSVLSYTMQGGDEKFIYNRTTGMIQLAQKVDREIQDHYKLVVVAVDQGKPPLESSMTINVIISDSIDSAPYFDSAIVNIEVNESLPINSIIYTVKARDNDLNDVIRYKLTSSLVQELELNTESGEIKLIKPLNRENVTNFEMKFQAVDSNGLSSPVYGLTLRIKVTDVNDNSPVFSQRFYLNDVVENTPDGTIVMQVLAIDPDEGENGRITYSIKEDLLNLLRIDPTEGLITKYGLWQITPGGFLNFTVIATDGGRPARRGSVNCSIRWVAVNALNPQFNKSLYSVAVSERAIPGTEVIQMTAYKRGKVEPVIFSISGGQGHFSIERNTGVIRVSNPLDRESADQFAITVTATDNQSPPQTGVTSVKVEVTDVNDNKPKFSLDTYQFFVSEDAAVSSTVGRVVAVDQDTGNNSKLSYSIQSGNEKNWFAISPVNGTIQTASQLDREEQAEVMITVMVRDHGSNSLNSTVPVSISILDINDNKPTFANETYSISITENLPGDTQVLVLSATDGDNGRNGTVFYSIISGNELGNFYIGRTTGVLRLAKVLDYETVTSFSLRIQAVDDGTPFNRSSISTVSINLIDVNDNIPRFQSPSYLFYVMENAPTGYRVGHVTAIDDDKYYNEIFFRISNNAIANSIFRISDGNGTITLEQSLDREKFDKYVFTLVAFNKDQNGNESLKSSVEITVNVMDENDNIPIFHPPLCCNVSVYENVEIGTTIVRISASDADAGLNKQISFEIFNGTQIDDFKIDVDTGDIKLKKSLNRERIDYYELIVLAKDHGTPMMSSNATIRITVLDINDNAPIFAPVNVSTVSEDTAIGTVVAKVWATDGDTGTNGEIQYEILAGNEDGSFTLSPNTGRIKIAKALDYEKRQSYSLRIIARDNGTPSISSITTLQVNITNVNDNIPKFVQEAIYVSFKENSPVGSKVMTCFASDADRDPVYYYIHAGNERLFAIDEISGVLRNLQVLDREEAQLYSLTIEATNLKKKDSVARSRRDTALPSSLAYSRQTVTIQIADENDNPPVFTRKEYRAGISENAKYGTSILQVVAIDVDIGENNNISYVAIDNSNTNNLFRIERKTGWIVSAQSFIGRVGQNFQLKILAEDNDGNMPNFNDTTIVNIFVLTDNQRVVLTMKVSPQIVRDNINEIIQGLENITSFKINIDEIQFSSYNGVYDTTSTDLVFHAVDRVTNTIQDKDSVILAIERNQVIYQAFFQKWKVQSVKAVVAPTSAPFQDDTQTILIAVAASLFLIIIGFAFAIYHIRRKQGRKLKAASASSKDSDATAELEHMQKLRNIVKGGATGKESGNSYLQRSLSKASERFYPMWIEPKDDNFDSARPLLRSFHVKCSSASYCEENKSISNTRTVATEILMMSDPYIGETVVDYYEGEEDDCYYSEDMSDMYDSQTDGEIDQGSGVIAVATALQTLSKEELLLRASLQPTATLQLDGINVTSI